MGGKSAVFYRYRDASGRVHIVDSLDRVPTALRGKVERVEYQEETPVNGLLPSQAPSGWQAFALGAVAALLLWFAFKKLPRWVLVAGIGVVLCGAYFGWVRRTAQVSSDAFASPSAMIDDAKLAVEKMNARLQAQQAELKEAERAK